MSIYYYRRNSFEKKCIAGWFKNPVPRCLDCCLSLLSIVAIHRCYPSLLSIVAFHRCYPSLLSIVAVVHACSTTRRTPYYQTPSSISMAVVSPRPRRLSLLALQPESDPEDSKESKSIENGSESDLISSARPVFGRKTTCSQRASTGCSGSNSEAPSESSAGGPGFTSIEISESILSLGVCGA